MEPGQKAESFGQVAIAANADNGPLLVSVHCEAAIIKGGLMEYNPTLNRKIKDSVDLIHRDLPYWILDCEEIAWDLKTPI